MKKTIKFAVIFFPTVFSVFLFCILLCYTLILLMIRGEGHRKEYVFRDIGEASITNIIMTEDRMVIEVERSGGAINGFQNSVDIMYENIPDVWISFISEGKQVTEEWHGDDESTRTITLDLSSTYIAASKGDIDPLNRVQIYETLYTNEKAELYVGFSYLDRIMAEIVADVIFGENNVRILGQKTYKPYMPFESIEEYEQDQIRMRQNADTEEQP